MCDLNADVVLDKYFGELEQRDEFSGVVLITNGQSKLYSGLWLCQPRQEGREHAGTRLDTASITKLFTSVATLQLIDRGLL